MEANVLLKYKNWVVVGDVLNSEKYAYRILEKLKRSGFNAVGVNPKDVSGQVYKSLGESKTPIEVIDLCIHPSKGIAIIKEAAELGINKILIQPGAESDEILAYCKENHIVAIEGCALIELSNFKGL